MATAMQEASTDTNGHGSWGRVSTPAFNRGFNRVLDFYEQLVRRALASPG